MAIALSLTMNSTAIASEPIRRFAVTTLDNEVIEAFSVRKAARQFKDDYKQVHRIVTKVVTLDYQPNVGDVLS
jgi:hypothetical protein